ncbi:MAG: restriction endonuclease subunit S [Cyanobacteria bacterium]|nr:restriction endonuclease subunit S [Cyanobacteriota bacterium]
MIPEDWDVKPLHNLSEKIMVGIASAATHAYRDRGIVLLRNQNIKPGYLDDLDILHITPEYESSFKNKRLKSGDLLTARTGYPGTTCVVPPAYESAQSFTTLITRPNLTEVDSRFLCCYINSEGGQKFFEQNQIGGGQKNVNAGSLKQLPVPLPPTIAEQNLIARALSDTDALIESLEQLLTKKRQIKQGAMQELLTGKKRLLGSSKSGWQKSEIGEVPTDWNVTEISKISNVKTGPFGSALHESDYVDDGTPIITVEHLGETGVTHNNLPLVSDLDKKRLSSYLLEEGDIVFSRVGSVDRNARISPAENGWLFSGRLLRLRPLDRRKIDTNYLSYYFHSEPFKQRIYKVAVGQTMASLNTQILKSIFVALPLPKEQTAIATILSDMDLEIGAIETKLTKARQLKQGMMHELLTGRIRLVEEVQL